MHALARRPIIRALIKRAPLNTSPADCFSHAPYHEKKATVNVSTPVDRRRGFYAVLSSTGGMFERRLEGLDKTTSGAKTPRRLRLGPVPSFRYPALNNNDLVPREFADKCE